MKITFLVIALTVLVSMCNDAYSPATIKLSEEWYKCLHNDLQLWQTVACSYVTCNFLILGFW